MSSAWAFCLGKTLAKYKFHQKETRRNKGNSQRRASDNSLAITHARSGPYLPLKAYSPYSEPCPWAVLWIRMPPPVVALHDDQTSRDVALSPVLWMGSKELENKPILSWRSTALKQSRYHWSDHWWPISRWLSANRTVSACSPSPPSVKALALWSSVGGACLRTHVHPPPLAPNAELPASKRKQTFLSQPGLCGWAFEQWAARPHFLS